MDVTVNKSECSKHPFAWLNDPAWDNNDRPMGLLFVGFQDSLGNRGQWFCQGLEDLPSGLYSFLVQTLRLSGSMGADGVIRIATLVVKYLDRGKSNYCEGISQACLH